MRIASISPYETYGYVYRVNAVSSNSLSKVNRIGDDLLLSKTDFSEMTKSTETTNPLRRGETANFTDVLMMQMQMGKMNAGRIMKPAAQDAEENIRKMAADNNTQANNTLYQMQRASEAYQMNLTA